MKHIIKALAVASAMAAVSAAHAQTTPITMPVGVAVFPGLDTGIGLQRGNGTLVFSETLIGALEVAGIQTSAVTPAIVNVVTAEDGMQISANAPVVSLSGDLDIATGALTVNQVATAGGALMVAPKKNFATSTGSLSLTGITVDLSTKSIYADLTGGNGVGILNDVHVWNYANIEGSTTLPPVYDTTVVNNKITGLTITTEAFNLFAKSLGLTSGGVAAMREITDYGVMNSQIVIGPVPEPSTYAMMGIGLVGLLVASKRARRA